jgi:hypothetical protein
MSRAGQIPHLPDGTASTPSIGHCIGDRSFPLRRPCSHQPADGRATTTVTRAFRIKVEPRELLIADVVNRQSPSASGIGYKPKSAALQ